MGASLPVLDILPVQRTTANHLAQLIAAYGSVLVSRKSPEHRRRTSRSLYPSGNLIKAPNR